MYLTDKVHKGHMEVTRVMNSRRLVRLLQAVSYDVPAQGHSVPARDICENRISIQEAIELYMQTAAQLITPPVEQHGRKTTMNSQEAAGREEKQQSYLTVMEANRIESCRRRDAREHNTYLNQKKKKRGRAGATVQSLPTDADSQRANAFDQLDVNRTAGYLLYSYDRRGTHSILGEDIRPGGYGDRITMGEYANKA